MDAVPTLSDWGTTSLGTFYDINSRATLRTTVSSMYMNPQMITCGGEVGLNVSF
jgi:outer membrane lipase/esterase